MKASSEESCKMERMGIGGGQENQIGRKRGKVGITKDEWVHDKIQRNNWKETNVYYVIIYILAAHMYI